MIEQQGNLKRSFTKTDRVTPPQGPAFLTGFLSGPGQISRWKNWQNGRTGIREKDAGGHIATKCRHGELVEVNQNRNHFIITIASSPFL